MLERLLLDPRDHLFIDRFLWRAHHGEKGQGGQNTQSFVHLYSSPDTRSAAASVKGRVPRLLPAMVSGGSRPDDCTLRASRRETAMLSMLNVPIADDDPEDLAMKTSDLLVQCLENEGVEYVFGIPGEENLDFLESLRESKIELIPTRHEQAAG